MENYFTLPKLMEILQEFMIGVVVTARFVLDVLVNLARKFMTSK